jgi:hypothetical protein
MHVFLSSPKIYIIFLSHSSFCFLPFITISYFFGGLNLGGCVSGGRQAIELVVWCGRQSVGLGVGQWVLIWGQFVSWLGLGVRWWLRREKKVGGGGRNKLEWKLDYVSKKSWDVFLT